MPARRGMDASPASSKKEVLDGSDPVGRVRIRTGAGAAHLVVRYPVVDRSQGTHLIALERDHPIRKEAVPLRRQPVRYLRSQGQDPCPGSSGDPDRSTIHVAAVL